LDFAMEMKHMRRLTHEPHHHSHHHGHKHKHQIGRKYTGLNLALQRKNSIVPMTSGEPG
jgi:hypothetical protein